MACPTTLKRTLKRGNKGRDVLGIKYGLRKAGFKAGLVMTDRFGAAMWYNVRRFQKAHGLKVDGQVGLNTYRAFRKYIPAYGCWLLNHYTIPVISKTGTIVKTALYASTKEPYIHYTQGPLRMQGVRNKIKPPSFPRYEDCSSFSTWCYWVAGMPDPNGLNYNGFGYTGTMTQHGRRVTSPLPGDLVFYGGSSSVPSHVAVYVGDGKVVSHGSESGPKVAAWNYRTVNQIRRYT